MALLVKHIAGLLPSLTPSGHPTSAGSALSICPSGIGLRQDGTLCALPARLPGEEHSQLNVYTSECS